MFKVSLIIEVWFRVSSYGFEQANYSFVGCFRVGVHGEGYKREIGIKVNSDLSHNPAGQLL